MSAIATQSIFEILPPGVEPALQWLFSLARARLSRASLSEVAFLQFPLVGIPSLFLKRGAAIEGLPALTSRKCPSASLLQQLLHGNSSNSDVVTATGNAPRQLQTALKLVF